MKVLFFAQSRDAAGCPEHELKVANALTISQFWTMLLSTFPHLAPMQSTARLARRETYLHHDDLLQPTDEIAVIPPVSGG
jgi:molybdopterin converting factor subunit 1